MFKNSNYLWRISYYLAYFSITYYYFAVLLVFSLLVHINNILSTSIIIILLILNLVSLFVIKNKLTDTKRYINTLQIAKVKLVPKNMDNYYKEKYWTVATLVMPAFGILPFIYYPTLTIIGILLLQWLLYFYQTKKFGFCYANYGLYMLGYDIVPVVPVGDNKLKYIFYKSDSTKSIATKQAGDIVLAIPLQKDSEIGINI